MAAATGGASVRALDAIHVASALSLGAEVESFLTYDAGERTPRLPPGYESLPRAAEMSPR